MSGASGAAGNNNYDPHSSSDLVLMFSENLAHSATSPVSDHRVANFSGCDDPDAWFFFRIRQSSNSKSNQQTSRCDAVFSHVVEFGRLAQSSGFREGELFRHVAT
jgi:hypothetical protein